ncbi:MAG: glycosyltransferase [Spirochaetales bacterium]|nr:glycosyltransferase [Spirochaetales bacterium]
MSNSPKNIAFVISGLDVGGAELLVVETVLALKSYYNSVHLLYLKNCNSLMDNNKYRDLNPLYLDFDKNGFIKSTLKLRKYIKNNKIDIVHSHLSLANIVTKVSSIGLSKLSFYNTYHNMDKRLAMKKPSVFVYNFIDRFFVNFFKNHFSIAISNAVKNYHCQVVKLRPGKVLTIYNGVFKNGQCLRANRGYSDIQKILTVGRLEEVKNIGEQIYFIKRIKELGFDNVSLTIVGDGSEMDRLKNLVDNLHLNHCVEFLGSRLDTENIFPNYDLFISSSIVEGFGLTILEAISYGLPVIATNTPAVKEILQNGKYGFLYSSGDLDQLVNTWQKIVNVNNIKDFVTESYNYFKNNFSFETYLQRIKDLE